MEVGKKEERVTEKEIKDSNKTPQRPAWCGGAHL